MLSTSNQDSLPQSGIVRAVPFRPHDDELAILLPQPSLDDELHHVVIDRRVRQLELLRDLVDPGG